MNWPFTTRARLNDSIARNEELRQELSALRDTHERLLDEVNYRSTGFHLFARFDKKVDDAPKPKADALNDAADEPTGGRIRTHLAKIEQDNQTKYREELKTRQALEAAGRARAAEQLETALTDADQRAQA